MKIFSIWFFVLATAYAAVADDTSQVVFGIHDEKGAALPCRIHLKDKEGVAQRAPNLPFWRDHFVCPGEVTVDLAPGKYSYEIERGPEHTRASGRFELRAGERREIALALRRRSDLRSEGWYSADLHVHRPLEEIELLMQAEDLDYAPVITWWNNKNLWKEVGIPVELSRKFDEHRLYHVMAGEDEREGGALLYFGLDKPLGLMGSSREYPSPMQFVEQARKQNADVWIDIEKPFWWDVPLWLASGKMKSIGLANNHMCRSQMYANEAWGKPRDPTRLPNPQGNGYWTQEIYYHALNSGLRIPPSAGSASGVLPNPVGYNRVYVHLDGSLTEDAWFKSLSEGRCFVTNGPILLVKANQEWPGTVFETEGKNPLKIQIDIRLTSNDPISALELIQNGRMVKRLDVSDEATQEKSLTMEVDEPGWFLVRAIADVKETFRFASTGPWYVKSPQVSHRIGRKSAQFFLDWTEERIGRITKNLSDESQRAKALKWHEDARDFWKERVKMANAD